LFDTMVVVDPDTFPARLQAAGFDDVFVDVMKPYASASGHKTLTATL
jgi:hypothetical protein